MTKSIIRFVSQQHGCPDVICDIVIHGQLDAGNQCPLFAVSKLHYIYLME